jgi:anti-sigma factor RsiW
MNTAIHPVTPEEVMAFLDGELAVAEAQAVSTHLDECDECAGLAERFRSTSESLAQWTVPPVPSSLEEAVMTQAASAAAGSVPAKPGRSAQLSFLNWRLWAVGGGSAVTAVLLLVAFTVSMTYYEDRPRPSPPMATMIASPNSANYAKPQSAAGLASLEPTQDAVFGAGTPRSPALTQAGKSRPEARIVVAGMGAGGGGAPLAAAPAASAPMIARAVSLSIVVKDFAAARASLDSILLRHRGYAAQLIAATQENAPRSFQASLRIPAPELAATLAELKALGRVENESQAGEEVTQQHADLAARLQNSRETEERLRAILEQRTGKIEDVLQVEEEIARVRGEIEQMEAEQQALEHRVEFARVDLQLTEEFKAELNPPSASVSNRLHNALVAGLRNAAETVLGLVLFLVESGPVLLIWLAIFGLPVFALVLRYRRMRAKL